MPGCPGLVKDTRNHAAARIPSIALPPMQNDDPENKVWSGRFSEPVNELVKHFTRR